MFTRLTAFQLYNQAHILILIFDLDDPESLERVLQLHCDFQESNNNNGKCYQILVGTVTKESMSR